MPRARHIVGLIALVLLVAYFGVWLGYETVARQFGPAWGMVAAGLLLAGLAVIAAVGSVVVRTMRAMEPGAGAKAKKAGNQPD
jgi:hypothetical protein